MAMNKSVIKAINILELISKNNEATLSEISAQLDLPPASVSDILKALLQKQMIEIADKRAKTYRISINSFLIGNSYLANASVIEIAMPFVNDLSKQTGNTVFLGKPIDGQIIYLYKCEPSNTLISTCQIGSRANLTTTALGKVAMAFDDELAAEALKKPLPAKTAASITDADLLKKELVQVKNQGYALDMFEADERVICVGFPIFSRSGAVEHCISISGAARSDEDIRKDIELGTACAEEISKRLGYV